MKHSVKPGELPLLTPRQIFERLGLYVIGQERARRAVAIAAYNHLKRCAARRYGRASLVKKSNLLLIGPTGSGKTHIARTLADVLEVPFSVADATEYTEAGYYGKDVEVMIAELLFKADYSLEDAQRGVVFIDEVDKIARRSHGARTGAGSRDIGGEGVQQALLKLLEGREVYVPLNQAQHWSKHDLVQVDTSDILFICAGTFSDLYAYRGERAVGFAAPPGGGRGRRELQRRRVTLKELLEYGMLAELMGRLPVVVELEELTEVELFRILTEPPDSLLREFQELLSLEGIELSLSEGALKEVARWAHEKRLGARALRAIFEELMSEVMFHAPERRGARIGLDASTVKRRLGAFSAEALRES
ncbi:MAG: ATP-dependent Clp protease ATP-binding subunit ClpX [Deltaproteobacteria bacterium]|nr:ATP-dependent Clp protease ATP-binding subunit ClpX [Deltaproteobacteria bacterium]